MTVAKLTQDAILRVGEVIAVEGRKVFVLVDKNKNLSDMFLDGEILRNLSVNSYIEIRKGFLLSRLLTTGNFACRMRRSVARRSRSSSSSSAIRNRYRG